MDGQIADSTGRILRTKTTRFMWVQLSKLAPPGPANPHITQPAINNYKGELYTTIINNNSLGWSGTNPSQPITVPGAAHPESLLIVAGSAGLSRVVQRSLLFRLGASARVRHFRWSHRDHSAPVSPRVGGRRGGWLTTGSVHRVA